ncbi:MAG TPA: Mur ligase family protein, partial [Jiangellaceae bacterium]|nr:Mur ligase family protein [Jiangellaceae bacterium]
MSPRPSLRPRHVNPCPVVGLAALLGVDPAPELGGLEVTGVTHDSRQVRPGDLYAALPGASAHGASYAGRAADAGAVAVLTDAAGADVIDSLPVLVVADPRADLGRVASRVYGDPARDLLVVGVTGTNGKTTTSYLVESGLRAAGHRTGMIGTVETRIGDERVVSERTTPEAPEVHALLALMCERGVTACVMEVSSHALVYGRVDGIVFDVAGFTNLSRDHLDFHTDLEDYFAAKASLFTPDRSRRGVVVVDDEYGRRLASREGTVPVTTVST